MAFGHLASPAVQIDGPHEKRSGGPKRREVISGLLTYTEAFEDVAEQVVGGALAGDFLQRGAGFLKIEQWKFFGDF